MITVRNTAATRLGSGESLVAHSKNTPSIRSSAPRDGPAAAARVAPPASIDPDGGALTPSARRCVPPDARAPQRAAGAPS
ncbi:MAG: hypothetical protein U1E76_05800 [Planctomycetota bacterium]